MIDSDGQRDRHILHLMQASTSITCGSFFSPDMASVGHTFTQAVQPVHVSGSMLRVMSAGHEPAVHLWLKIWSSYSFLK
jgi:hypothetical protein